MNVSCARSSAISRSRTMRKISEKTGRSYRRISSRNAASRPCWASATTSASGRFARSRSVAASGMVGVARDDDARAGARADGSYATPQSAIQLALAAALGRRRTFVDDRRDGAGRRVEDACGRRRRGEAGVRPRIVFGDRAALRSAESPAQLQHRPAVATARARRARLERGTRRHVTSTSAPERSTSARARAGTRGFRGFVRRRRLRRADVARRASARPPPHARGAGGCRRARSCRSRDGIVARRDRGVRDPQRRRASTRRSREVLRVLAPGARFVILEFSTPRSAIVRGAYHVYFHHVLPRDRRVVISGHRTAYQYLPESVAHFPRAALADA